jgi:hypothetical protein
VSANFDHGHAFDANVLQSGLDGFEAGGLDDGFKFRH